MLSFASTAQEKKLGDYERAVRVRRSLFESILEKPLELIPYQHYDYKKVFGANCEIVLGYVPIPLGIVGPLVRPHTLIIKVRLKYN